MTKRIDYLDIAKGIGILLVVMGHNDFELISPLLNKLFHAFRMPLFFFVSGMFFNLEQPFLRLLRRRFESVLKPYFVIALIIYIVTLSFSRASLLVTTTQLLKSFYATPRYIDWVPLWFLPHLFAVNIFAFWFYWLVKHSRLPWLKWVLLPIVLIIGVLTIDRFWPITLTFSGKQFSIYGLPFSLDLVLISGFFFILGKEIKILEPGRLFSNPLPGIFSGVILLCMVILLPQNLDLSTRIFDSLVVNTIEAALGILFVLTIARLIEKNPFLLTIFRYIGQSSLIILIFHLPIEEAWGEKMLSIFHNPVISFWIAYTASILGPILINHYLIKPNHFVRSWFGQQPIPNDPISLSVPTTESCYPKYNN